MYGQIKGDEEETSCDESPDSLDKKIPLLQEKIEVYIKIPKVIEAGAELPIIYPEASSILSRATCRFKLCDSSLAHVANIL